MASSAATDPLQISPAFTPQVFVLRDTSHLSPTQLSPLPCPQQSQGITPAAQASAVVQVQDASLDPTADTHCCVCTQG